MYKDYLKYLVFTPPYPKTTRIYDLFLHAIQDKILTNPNHIIIPYKDFRIIQLNISVSLC